MDTAFEEDLGADSVDLVELVIAIEEEFEVGEIQEEDLSGLKTVGDTVNYIASGSLGAAQGAYGRALARTDDVMPPQFKKGGKFGKSKGSGKGKGFGKRR